MERIRTRMTAATQQKNRQALIELLPCFFYNDATNTRIRDTLHPLKRPYVHTLGDKFFQVGSDLRAFYRVPLTPDIDNGYQRYRNVMHTNGHPVIFDYPEVLEYGVYTAGRFFLAEKKQEVKLFKWLLQSGAISEVQADFINEVRNTKDLYFCISRNPLDFLFCSTHQPFSSCMSVDSEHDGSYYMALMTNGLDPALAMTFFTDGKVHRHEIKGSAFKHFRYIQREFVYAIKACRVYIDRSFPAVKYDTSDFLRKAGLKPYEYKFTNKCKVQSLFSFDAPRFEDNRTFAMPYRDHIGYHITNNDGIVRVRADVNGSTGTFFDFANPDGFDAVDCYDDLWSQNRCICSNCEERTDENDIRWTIDGGVCRECFDNNYFHCTHCGDVRSQQDGHYLEAYDRYVCQNCLENRYFFCDECQEHIIDRDMVNADDGETYCRQCFYNVYDSRCPDCNALCKGDDAELIYNGVSHCEDCIETRITRVFNLEPSWMRAIRVSAAVRMDRMLNNQIQGIA